MTKQLKDAFPPPDELLKLEPEEIAVFLLDYLCDSDEGKEDRLNRYSRSFSILLLTLNLQCWKHIRKAS